MINKQLLLTLNASIIIQKEMFLRDCPLTQDMIGVNWIAKELFLSHQEEDSLFSSHILDKTRVKMNIVENNEQIIISVSE